jgi:hypothetical protein
VLELERFARQAIRSLDRFITAYCAF